MPDKHWSTRRTKANRNQLGTNMTTYNVMVLGYFLWYTGFVWNVWWWCQTISVTTSVSYGATTALMPDLNS